jgi:hypothetical protein
MDALADATPLDHASLSSALKAIVNITHQIPEVLVMLEIYV